MARSIIIFLDAVTIKPYKNYVNNFIGTSENCFFIIITLKKQFFYFENAYEETSRKGFVIPDEPSIYCASRSTIRNPITQN